MINKLSQLPKSNYFWLTLIVLSILLEGVALYYQYQLDYLPCVLCIHIRMLVFLLLLVSLVAFLLKRTRNVCFVIASLTWFWILERSWQTLGTEMGWVLGECQMSSGLPSWFALEKWFPWIFEIHEPCGYTPYLFFEISMAQALVGLSVTFSLICFSGLLLMVKRR